MKRMFCALLVLSLLLCALPLPASARDALSFRDDGTFRILHLTDTQDDAVPSPDMLNLLKLSIETADPDLIVFTGDLVEDSRLGDVASDAQPLREGVNVKDLGGALNYEKTRANVEKAVADVFGVFESYEIPYVVALGNNDRKVGLSTADWLEIFAAYPHCVIRDDSPDEAGGIDYYVTIRGTDGADKFNVWLGDTTRHGISDAQIDWYQQTSRAITARNGAPVPAFWFQHIQAADIGNLFEPCKMTDEGARKGANGFVRVNREIAGGNSFYGWDPCEPSYEFRAWKACGDVIGAFFGHQHVEGVCGTFDGIEMGFTYGCEMAKTGPYGFRVFTLHEDDLTHYDNTLYRYTGKAALGTAKVSPETNEPYSTPANGLEAFFLKLAAFFRAAVSAIIYVFS